MIIEAVLWAVMAQGPNTMPDSLYTGKWYVKAAEPFRKCVMWRESRGNYKADGPYGSGGYQFVSGTWDHYAELAGHAEWVGVRPAKAPKYVQDHVFWRTYWKGRGKHHWSSVHALTIGKKVRDC